MANKVYTILGALNILFKHPKYIFGYGSAVYKPLEEVIITEFVNRLSPEDSEIATSQLDEINCVERVHIARSETGFNMISGMTYSLARSKHFADQPDEYVIQKIDFLVKGRKFRALFYVVFGNLYSIEFTGDVSEFLSETDIEFL